MSLDKSTLDPDEEEEEAAPPPPLPGKRPSLRPVPEPLQQRRSEKEILNDEDGGKHLFHFFILVVI